MLGARHAMLVYTSPRSLFARVEDTGAYGSALLVLLVCVVLLGYAEAQTGLIDRAVDRHTEQALAGVEEAQGGLVDRIELRERMDDVRQAGEFSKLIARLGTIVFRPVWLLASLLFISSILYAAVAMTGRKPEYHTLMSIVVYAAFIELAGLVVRFLMVIFYRNVDVDTSLALLAEPGKPTALVAADPYRLWFWILVAVGLIVTRQLGRRSAIAMCVLMALIAGGARVALAYGAQH